MSGGVDWILWGLAAVLAVDLVAILRVIVVKRRSRAAYRQRLDDHFRLTGIATGADPAPLLAAAEKQPVTTLEWLSEFAATITIDEEIRRRVVSIALESGGRSEIAAMLSARRLDRRLNGARLVRTTADGELIDRLADRLLVERSPVVAAAGWYTLIALDEPVALDLISAPLPWVGHRIVFGVVSSLAKAGPRIQMMAAQRANHPEFVVREAVLEVASANPVGDLAEVLRDALDGGLAPTGRMGTTIGQGEEDVEFRRLVFRLCRERQPHLLDHERYRLDVDPVCRAEAFRAYLALAPEIDMDIVAAAAADPATGPLIEHHVAQALIRHPDVVDRLVFALVAETDSRRRGSYARMLGGRQAYLIHRFMERDPETAGTLIEAWVEVGAWSGIVDVLNRNRNASLEAAAARVLQRIADRDSAFGSYCARYLRAGIADRLSLPVIPAVESSARTSLRARDRVYLALLLLVVLAMPVGIYMLRLDTPLHAMTVGQFLRGFLVDYNYLFAGYAIALNVSYLLLLFLSSLELRRQSRLWAARDEHMLFHSGVLPSITILAPAWNEEASVVESVRSLLTIRYPDSGIVVINDGSTDRTLEVLIAAFELDRVDSADTGEIRTAPIRGAYRSRHIPNLLVLDKENGGKADALNAGINHATGTYVCAIDSDSLLTRDSLLAMAYPLIHDDREVVAVGGNIMPVNGCRVEHGHLRAIHAPEPWLPLSQSIEYLRSFIAARMGWARYNALLIISGAFGLFRRDRVREVGGYSTGTSVHGRDTVGEDMELVVRLVRHMREGRHRFAVNYAYNANCWTEVPEDLGSLLKQRDRWQRGLIEIMSFHKSMLLNPRYGASGMIALPYLFVFELIGPFFEALGYVVVLVCLVLGLLSLRVVALLFAATVGLGILVSLGSLLASENGVIYFHGRDFRRILGAAIRENFGFRQFMSLRRSLSYVAYIFRDAGWQHLTRRGFGGGS